MNLPEIEKRMVELRDEISKEDADLNAIETEINNLKEEKRALIDSAEKREKMLADAKEFAQPIHTEKKEERKNMEIREIAALPEYRTGWLKSHMGIALTEEEKRSVAMTNATSVIPVVTAQKIFALIEQKANLLNYVDLYRVNGAVTVPIEATNTDAALHTENALMDAAPDTWSKIDLNAFEIVKFVRFSKSLMKMAIDKFEAKLVEKIADKIVAKVEGYILYGTGDAQPKGVNAAQTWSDGTNGVDWAGAAPTAAEIIELVSYFPGGHYQEAKWIMNHKTFFNRVYSLRDDAKSPLVREVGDKFYIIGKEVLLTNSAADDDIFLADLKQVVANLSEDIVVERSDASGFAYNAIDFRGSCVFDCDIAVPKAFVKSEATLG